MFICCWKANSVEYPTLYCIDLIESSKLNSSTTQQQQQQQNEILAEKNKIEDETRGSSAASRARPQTARRVDTIIIISSSSEYVPCIRAMCEFQDGWHPSSSFISITSNSSNKTGLSSLLKSFASYLTRVMSIVKNGPISSELQVLLSVQGRRTLGDIETTSDHKDIVDSYVALVKHVLGKHEQEQEQQQQDKLQHGDNFEGSSKMGLIRCELKSGKTMWLCKKHMEANRARPVVANDTRVVNTTIADHVDVSWLQQDLDVNIF